MRTSYYTYYASAILGFSFIYLSLKLIKHKQWQLKNIIILEMILFLTIFLTPVSWLMRSLNIFQPFPRGLSLMAYIGIGFHSVLLLFYLLVDLTNLLIKIGHFITRRKNSFNPKRRDFLRASLNVGAVLSASGLTSVGLAQTCLGPRVDRVNVPIKDLPLTFEGFKIVQISDLHVGLTIKKEYVDQVIAKANSLSADMFALTGDFVDGSVEDLKQDVAPLANLKSTFGSFFCTGNHEYYSGVNAWCDHFRSLGIVVLNNQHHLITKNDQKIVIGGVTDYRAHRFDKSHQSNPRLAFQEAPAGLTRILLCHQPKNLQASVHAGVQLQLSGHTHAGQYFPFNLVVKHLYPFYQGLGKLDQMWIYVNRGTGYWGPPLRTGIPSEITLLTLTRG